MGAVIIMLAVWVFLEAVLELRWEREQPRDTKQALWQNTIRPIR